MLTAKEARQLLKNKYDEELRLVFEDIKDCSERGENSVNIDQDRMTEQQAEYLRDLGYKVSWNRACTWYEVDW